MNCALSLRHGSLSRRLNDGVYSRTRKRLASALGSQGWKEWTTTERTPLVLAAAETALTDSVGSQEKDENEISAPQRATGLLHQLPHIATPEEMLSSAIKRARRVGKNKKLSGPAAQAKNLAARQMDQLMKELTTPLTSYLKRFPVIDRLHSFEAALLDLTVTEERYLKVLARVLQLRKTATSMGKEYASRGAKAASKKEAERIAEEGFVAMESLINKNRGILVDLVDVTRKLRQLPKLDLGVPTLALVGAPNVGKSSLVKSISSGRPEICNYPFTTRSIKMGHFYVDGRRHQVTDTPGLLNRPEEEKNTMELLTMATLRYLPTAVVFVLDATEQCGMSMEDQFAIRSHLKESFPSKAWVDVISKSDLLQAANETADTAKEDKAEQENALSALPNALRVSCVTEEGVDQFKGTIMHLFTKDRL